MNKVPMTSQGMKTLQEELTRLKSIDRPNVVQAISEARAHGDLKENAEYHAAKEQQGFIEARIKHLDGALSNAQIIDVTNFPNEGRVIFGTTVTLLHIENDIEVTYQIVGEDEADIKESKISVQSPIARALVGKYVEEEVVVATPSGDTEYVIIKVEHL